jgi:prophage regulatory protein
MRILRWKAVKERCGLSRTSVWRLEKANKFPRRIQIGPKAVGWLEAELDAWVTTNMQRSREQFPQLKWV